MHALELLHDEALFETLPYCVTHVMLSETNVAIPVMHAEHIHPDIDNDITTSQTPFNSSLQLICPYSATQRLEWEHRNAERDRRMAAQVHMSTVCSFCDADIAKTIYC